MHPPRPRIATALARCIRLRCPACGAAAIFRRPFRIRNHCRACGVLFQREEGFFLGPVFINAVSTEALILVLYLASVLVVHPNEGAMLKVLYATAVLFPLLYFHHSWSLWLTLDHLVERLPEPPDRGSWRDRDREIPC